MRRVPLLAVLLAVVLALGSSLLAPSSTHAQGGRMREVGGYGLVLRDTPTFNFGSLDSQVNGTARAGEIVYINGWQIGVYHVGNYRWVAAANVRPIIDSAGRAIGQGVSFSGGQYYLNGQAIRLPAKMQTMADKFLANPNVNAPRIFQGNSVPTDLVTELVDTTQVRYSSGERVVATMRVTDAYGFIYLRTAPNDNAPRASTVANAHEILTAYEVVDGRWYRIGPNLWAPATWGGETLLFPENVAAYAPPQYYNGGKWISIDLDRQQLTAWEGADVVMATRVKTGKYGYATPVGTFQTFSKVPNERMSGSDYDLLDVGWTQYFTRNGVALHAAYWHNNYNGRPGSHGCVNMPPEIAGQVFNWAPVGTTIVSHNAYQFDAQDIADAGRWSEFER